MSDKEYQRAMADLLRLPVFCQAVRADEDGVLKSYDLDLREQERVRAVARHQGMKVNCMLYRAGRLVGITRRLPRTVELLRPTLREVFDAYVLDCPDAAAEFDQEALSFARFVVEWVERTNPRLPFPAEDIRTVLQLETAVLSQ